MKEYEICIRGQAKAVLLEADSTISIDAVGSRTVVTGQFRNQESLLGYLGHLRDLGLEVLSTKEVPVRRRRSADPGQLDQYGSSWRFRGSFTRRG